MESRLRPGAFIVADNADYSPDYLARVRSPGKRLHVDAVRGGCRAVDADRLKPMQRAHAARLDWKTTGPDLPTDIDQLGYYAG